MKSKTVFYNQAENVQSEVVVTAQGKYVVSLRDNDSDNILPYVRIYSNNSDAVAYAKSLIGEITSMCSIYF